MNHDSITSELASLDELVAIKCRFQMQGRQTIVHLLNMAILQQLEDLIERFPRSPRVKERMEVLYDREEG